MTDMDVEIVVGSSMEPCKRLENQIKENEKSAMKTMLHMMTCQDTNCWCRPTHCRECGQKLPK